MFQNIIFIIPLQYHYNTSKLKFHPNKCKQMRIGTRGKQDRQLTLGDPCTALERTIQEKDIGVIIYSNLSFEHHIAAIINQTFEYKDEKTMTTLFKLL